jgi:hypothetical protein
MIKTKIIAIVLAAQLIPLISSGQQISVFPWELPDVNVPISVTGLPQNATSFSWTSNCSSLTFANPTLLSTTFLIPRTSTCVFDLSTNLIELTFHYSVPSGTTQVAQQLTTGIRVLPFLEAELNNAVTTTIYPNESVRVEAKLLPNGTLPLSCITTTWVVTGGTHSSITLWEHDVFCPATAFGNTVLIDMSMCTTNFVLTQLTLNVKLRSPVFSQAPTQIGCGSVSPNNIIFAVSQPAGAGYYVWTYPPSLLTPVGAVNGSLITFDAIATGAGQVTVKAYASNGSPINSGIVTSPQFSICCYNGTITESVQINSGPYYQQSGGQINSTNDITATGAATMHAAEVVRLMPGFNAVYGCSVHIYNDGCSSTFYRMAMPIDSSNIMEIHQADAAAILHDRAGVSPEIKNSNTESLPAKKGLSDQDLAGNRSIRIIPNPSTALFSIEFGVLDPKPQRLRVIDGSGTVIVEVFAPTGNSYLLDLTEYPSGIYALRIDYHDSANTKLMVKSAE